MRLLRGVFWTRPEGRPPDELLLLAAHLFAGWGREPYGVLVGRSAARGLGLPDVVTGFRPEVALPTRIRRRQPRELRYRFEDLPPESVVHVGLLTCTTPLRTLEDLDRRTPFGDALAAADAALLAGLVTAQELAAAAGGRSGRSALRCADGRAESPLESRVRAEILAAGLPEPVLQHEVRDAQHRFVARVDLAWPARRLLVEADGATAHASPAALREDLRRQNALVAAGWTPLRFTWSDLGAIAPRVAAALRTPEAHTA